MARFRLSSLLGLFVFFPATGAQSATVVLFEGGRPVAGYREKVERLAPGDRVVFSDGRAFDIESVLGKGSHTLVVGIGGGKALRISRSAGNHPLLRGTSYADLLQGFHDSNEMLRENGLPVVRVFAEESSPREYVVVERLDIRFTYQEFLNGTGAARDLSLADRQAALRDFVEFARRTFRFRTVGDQLPEQIAYTPRGWLFFDYTSATTRAERVNDGTLFLADFAMFGANQFHMQNGDLVGIDERLPLPREIVREVHAAIRQERRKAGFTESFCTRVFRSLRSLFSS